MVSDLLLKIGKSKGLKGTLGKIGVPFPKELLRKKDQLGLKIFDEHNFLGWGRLSGPFWIF